MSSSPTWCDVLRLAGGVTVGNRVMLGGQVGVANQAKIGDGAIATGQTGIASSIAAGAIVSGSPALPNKLSKKNLTDFVQWLDTIPCYTLNMSSIKDAVNVINNLLLDK